MATATINQNTLYQRLACTCRLRQNYLTFNSHKKGSNRYAISVRTDAAQSMSRRRPDIRRRGNLRGRPCARSRGLRCAGAMHYGASVRRRRPAPVDY